MAAVWGMVYLPVFPRHHLLPSVPQNYILDANIAFEYALVAFSLVLLTGWVGQISLGQAAFVGVGAFTSSLLTNKAGIPFPANLPLAGVAAAGIAVLLGIVALRVRGLYLAVATLIFAWICDSYLFSASWFTGVGGGTSIKGQSIGRPGGVTVFDLTNDRILYLVLLAAVLLCWVILVNLRDSKTGRAFFAIRGSETAAVSLGIDVMRYKLLAFAVSGALAGIAGNLMLLSDRTVSSDTFQFRWSLTFLSIAVVGGITRPGGAVAAGGLFSGLNAFFVKFPSYSKWLDVITYGLLLAVLFLYPGGLAALGSTVADKAQRWREPVSRTVRRWLVAALDDSTVRPAKKRAAEPLPIETVNLARKVRPPRRRPAVLGRPKVERRVNPMFTRLRELNAEVDTAAVPEDAPPVEAATWRTRKLEPHQLPASRDSRTPLLEASDIVVQFGGLTAVGGVSLSVCEREIVGLIGPNGAGKTTMFNAIAALNRPKSGRVAIFGQDATKHPVHMRARMGVGRTFQLIQLFNQLSVFDNILVGTHLNNPSSFRSHLITTPTAIEAEREARDQVKFVIGMLGLEDIADRPVTGLPFGVLRQVEIARALVTGAPVLMLDEPASGLDNAETDEFSQLLRFLRAELGVTILLIEHDMRMVVSVCDYLYVMNQGELLAEGTPAEIQRNSEVRAAYLGKTAEPEPVGVSA